MDLVFLLDTVIVWVTLLTVKVLAVDNSRLMNAVYAVVLVLTIKLDIVTAMEEKLAAMVFADLACVRINVVSAVAVVIQLLNVIVGVANLIVTTFAAETV